MATIINIAPTTELEAVNTMLSAIGEAPITDVSAATQGDVAMAVNILRNVARELQDVAWKFNYESGVEIAPDADHLLWYDSSGALTELNVFRLPAGVTAWSMTKCYQNRDLDLVHRPAKQVFDSGIPAMVLYDRAYNRDGCDAERYPLVYIDTISAFNFENLPETARRYITVTAARRFAQDVLGSGETAGFKERDELMARRNFMRDQSDEQAHNMLDTVTAFNMLGQRERQYGGTLMRVRPGSNPVPAPFRATDLSSMRIVD